MPLAEYGARTGHFPPPEDLLPKGGFQNLTKSEIAQNLERYPSFVAACARYWKGVAHLLRTATLPINWDVVTSSPLMAPNRWTGTAESKTGADHIAYRSKPARAAEENPETLRTLRIQSFPIGGDSVMFLYFLCGNEFPTHTYSVVHKTWEDWSKSFMAAAEVPCKVGDCPFPAFKTTKSLWICKNPSTSWEDWVEFPLEGLLAPSVIADSLPMTRPPISFQIGEMGKSASLGKAGETEVEATMTELLASSKSLAEFGCVLLSTATRARAADLLLKTSKGNILIEVKNYSSPVPAKQLEKLERDLRATNSYAALLVAIGCGVVGCKDVEYREVLNESGGNSRLVILPNESTDRPLLGQSLKLALLSILSEREPTVPFGQRLSSAGREFYIRATLGQAQRSLADIGETLKQTTTAMVDKQQSALSQIVGAKFALGLAVESLKEDKIGIEDPGLDTVEAGAPSWEAFCEKHHPIPDAALVKQIWDALPKQQWEQKIKGGARYLVPQTSQDPQIKILTSGIHAVLPQDKWKDNQIIMQMSHVKMVGEALVIKLDAHSTPLLTDLIRTSPPPWP